MTAPPPTVIFLHIPRTGGTTFQKIPERNYDPNQILTFDGARHREQIERFAGLPESERAGYKFIQGHLYFGFHRLVPGNSTYATFLRDPIARAISFYSYARTHPDHYLYRSLTEEKLDLTTLLERRGTHELFNHQTRLISGDRSNLDRDVDRNALERAKQNLRTNFCFVGLTEEFSASLILLARMLGWSLPLHVKRNATRKGNRLDSIDGKTRALLREANALDVELHEFGRELFGAQLRKAGDSFESELRRFERLNFWGARAYQQYENLVHGVQRMTGTRQGSRAFSLKQTTGESSL